MANIDSGSHERRAKQGSRQLEVLPSLPLGVSCCSIQTIDAGSRVYVSGLQFATACISGLRAGGSGRVAGGVPKK